MVRTITPGTLVVASAYPDPPFDLVRDGVRGGFDIELIRVLAKAVGLHVSFVAYAGADFDGIFAGLSSGAYDAVISGTTITPHRETEVIFSQPYLEFDQAVAVNAERTPNVAGPAQLHGLQAGIQRGNTSDIVAKRYVADGTIAGIRYYPYDGIGHALDDLEHGAIGAVIKLDPVLSWLIRNRPLLRIAFTVPTHEQLGIAFAKTNVPLRDAIDGALAALRADGTVARLQAAWIPARAQRAYRG